MAEVTLGGERLGSGGNMKVHLRNFERSTHNLGYKWKSSIAVGTLVPFMTELALPADTFDIDLDVDVMTLPTKGPLFGSFKIQLDLFQVPIRLYQAQLHMNALGIGMKMADVPLPQLRISAGNITTARSPDNQQIDASCLFNYLGIRGIGTQETGEEMYRDFNAIPYLGFWDIYKNYYANKQEEIGVVIHRPFVVGNAGSVTNVAVDDESIPLTGQSTSRFMTPNSHMKFIFDTPFTGEDQVNETGFTVFAEQDGTDTPSQYNCLDLFEYWYLNASKTTVVFQGWKLPNTYYVFSDPAFTADEIAEYEEPKLTTFPLENIDTMRENILKHFLTTPYVVDKDSVAPYGLPMTQDGTDPRWSQQYALEGLPCKTYQSDLFNNWISTEWIDGANGISAVTAVDTSAGSFTIDELNLSRKIYDMLNRIALSGGSYDDWLDAVYTHNRTRSAENPIYLGGQIKTLQFQEVVSNSAAVDEPLGSLAGRGRPSGSQKGGHVVVKVDEPSYIIGIVSLTPIVDYSQGNKWDVNLKTMDDLHKPSLDQIGFQDLVTDQMAFYDTDITGPDSVTFFSAGKQPAWINYMTNVNVCKGTFAIPSDSMWMTLNRRYGFETSNRMSDLTTYIDPAKFNFIFANGRRDAQNFWMQIDVKNTARRKMSAKTIPNL